ncbi:MULTISPECIES: PAS domain-containing methyl-accepting chemotaxis protein [unclassified Methylobacterium]|uniref:methyl-accepting chemotaxis protein n=1 Tax=unclassified Methylobacterium TaxID=2615210 RepID=UPI0006F235D1|nr:MULTISPECIES: PAS domain-containing methyl-accepting chemotaxis protein [unclassified Methylobacterium]KQO59053.1 chemotaxis protein [Methylobacterium sp. Leaf86]KQO89190.1 chemotaxis protein [Methylobacterium sp. Leaf91]
MLFSRNHHSTAEDSAKLAALERSQGVIEFDLNGTVVRVNENFLSVLGLSAEEVVGQQHRDFVEPAVRDSRAYKEFWEKLRAGEFQAGQFKRIGKDGREVWIEASYNPIFDRRGKPYKIIKFAADITRQKRLDADREGQIEAIQKAQAVIAFDLDGTIIEANENFLSVVGYTLPEIVGQRHRMFVDPAFADSPAYAAFWANLRQGEYQKGQFKRIGKDGREVWIEASYNPIFDASGRPYKVVKFSTDITAQVALLADLERLIEQNFAEIDGAVSLSSQESRSATQAAGRTASNVQTMAAASEELAASVDEISHSMSKARAATDDAHAQVEVAGAVTQKLTAAATAMSGIVALIQTIASQINLLALNATIEAARAGEAGRGFAVVAQEVKNLAVQAARATSQISSEIDSVQAASEQVTGTLGTIQGSVETMRDYVVSTAAAVEEQSVVTREISLSMQEAAEAVRAILQNVLAISASIDEVSYAVDTTKQAARVLAR